MQFQAVCSKANKKLTISLTAEHIEEARAILHGQGYSIMEIHEIGIQQEKQDNKINFFYFDIRVNGQIKTGKIQSNDVFKSYKKLIEDLWYDVVYIYTNEWMNEDQKKVITAKVRDSYRMYKQSVWEDIDEIKETVEQIEKREISPEILKQVEQYGFIIDSTIEKIQNLILKYHNTLSSDRRLELEDIEHSLLQVKWSSNLWKIKMNIENALKTIWKIELDLVKTGKEEEKKRFLQETNSLLKQIWSNERIETNSSQDVWKIISDLFSRFQKKEPVEKKESKKVDTNSFIYFKNQRELNTYKEIAEKNDRMIVKAVVLFQFSKIKRLFLKRRLLKQNIQIIDNRIHNRNISYTKIVHGFWYYKDSFLWFISYISRIGSYVLFFYFLSLVLLNIMDFFNILHFSFQSNKTILYITLFSLLVAIFSWVRSILSFIISVPIVYVIVIFLSINF